MPLLQDGRPLSFSVIQGQDQNSRLQLRQHMAFRQKIFDATDKSFLTFLKGRRIPVSYCFGTDFWLYLVK